MYNDPKCKPWNSSKWVPEVSRSDGTWLDSKTPSNEPFAAPRVMNLARTTYRHSKQSRRRPARSSTASWPTTRAPRTTARSSATAAPARSDPSGPRSTAVTPRSASKGRRRLPGSNPSLRPVSLSNSRLELKTFLGFITAILYKLDSILLVLYRPACRTRTLSCIYALASLSTLLHVILAVFAVLGCPQDLSALLKLLPDCGHGHLNNMVICT